MPTTPAARSTKTTAPRSPRRQRRGFGRLQQRDSGRWQAAYVNGIVLYCAPATFPTKGMAEGVAG